jgi:hypothetical protein
VTRDLYWVGCGGIGGLAIAGGYSDNAAWVGLAALLWVAWCGGFWLGTADEW